MNSSMPMVGFDDPYFIARGGLPPYKQRTTATLIHEQKMATVKILSRNDMKLMRLPHSLRLVIVYLPAYAIQHSSACVYSIHLH